MPAALMAAEGSRRVREWAAAAFAFVTLLPVFRRLLHPTLHGDDLIRIVNLVEHPLRELVFWPCNEQSRFSLTSSHGPTGS